METRAAPRSKWPHAEIAAPRSRATSPSNDLAKAAPRSRLDSAKHRLSARPSASGGAARPRKRRRPARHGETDGATRASLIHHEVRPEPARSPNGRATHPRALRAAWCLARAFPQRRPKPLGLDCSADGCASRASRDIKAARSCLKTFRHQRPASPCARPMTFCLFWANNILLAALIVSARIHRRRPPRRFDPNHQRFRWAACSSRRRYTSARASKQHGCYLELVAGSCPRQPRHATCA